MTTIAPKNLVLLAVLSALGACFLWSGNFILARGVHEWMPPMAFAFWRWVVAFVVLLPLGWPGIKRHKAEFLKAWKLMLFLGVVGVGAFNTLIYMAGHHTTAHHISLMAATAPISTLFLAGILGHDALTKRRLAAVLLALLGASVVLGHGAPWLLFSEGIGAGDGLALAGALCWGLYSACLRYRPHGLGQMAFLTVIVGIGMVSLIPFYLYEALVVAPTPFTLTAWGVYLYAGVASSAVAWLLWNYTISVIGPVRTTMLYYVMPMFTSVFAMLLLHEAWQDYYAIGFGGIIAGIVVGLTGRR
jgi:drug/metabolite transporter (DMT)-like permease